MAQAAKAMEPASDKIMSPGEMKPLLALSKREPVHAAIGITSDGDGVILLNKKMKSKKVLATLKAQCGKEKIQLQAATLRFGKAEVDTDYDPGMVRFFINKEAPGNMRIKLLEVIKRVPYQKVELNTDPSFEEESEDEAEGQETDANGVAVDPLKQTFETRTAELEPQLLAALRERRGDTSKLRAVYAFAQEKGAGGDYKAALAGLDALAKLLLAAGPSPNAATAGAPPPAPPRAATLPDAAALVRELTALARRIPEVPDTDPQPKIRLVKLATDANVNIKANHLNSAADLIAQLREALRDALDAAGVGVGAVVQPSGSDRAAASAPIAPAANGMAAWQAARREALASLKALEGAFRDMQEPESDQAIILVRAIQANLTAAPTTPAQVKELETYIMTDSIIEDAEMPNGFGFKVELRAPLLAALAALRDEQGAAEGQQR